MVNIDDFINRLEKILNYYNLSASAFADRISVQRSSLSHLLSGRNKPSLDFILKVIEEFPEVDLYWILNGKGNFPKSDNKVIINEEKEVTPSLLNTEKKSMDLFSEENTNDEKNSVFENLEKINANTQNFNQSNSDSEIDRIVIFFKDGTFKHYNTK